MPKKKQPPPTAASAAPTVMDSDELELWYDIWSRHVLFGEGTLDLQRHYAKQGQTLSLDLIQEAVNWGSENTVSIMENRRAKLGRAIAGVVSRRKLIWAEIQRLQRLQREQGGVIETVQTFDKKKQLVRTTVRTKDTSRALLAAEARLAELDRFCAALDGLLMVKDNETEQITAIDVNFDGLLSGMLEPPTEEMPRPWEDRERE